MAEDDKKKYRAHTGWVETSLDGEKKQSFVQHGGAVSKGEAMRQAKEVEGWVEENGVSAHVED